MHIDIQILSGLQPYYNIPKDVCVFVARAILAAQPRRPPNKALKDEHWGLIERCWVEPPSRPSAKQVHDALASLSHVPLLVLPNELFTRAPFVMFPVIG